MMRDKLTKTGHRTWYYRFRKLGITTAFMVAIGLIAIVPARQITIEIQNLQAAQTSEETTSVASDDTANFQENISGELTLL